MMRGGRWAAGVVVISSAMAAAAYWTYPLLYLTIADCPLDRQISALDDQERLFALAIRCADDRKRLALAGRLTDPKHLKEIALSQPSWVWQPRGAMVWPSDLRRLAVEKIRDQAVLAELVLREHEDGEIQLAAAVRLEDQETLERIASMGRGRLNDYALSRIAEPERIVATLVRRPGKFGGPTDTERQAIDQVKRDDLLETLAREVESFRVGQLVVERIEDTERLARLATGAASEEVREFTARFLRSRRDREVAAAARQIIEDRAVNRDVAELDDPAVLADLVIRLSEIYSRPWTTFKCDRDDVCGRALERLIAIGAEAELAEVVKRASGYDVQARALGAHPGTGLLAEIESYLVDVRIPGADQAEVRDELGRVLDDVRRDLAARALVDKVGRGAETRDEVTAAVRELLRFRDAGYIGLLRALLQRHADKRLMDFYLNHSSATEEIARKFAKYNGWTILGR